MPLSQIHSCYSSLEIKFTKFSIASSSVHVISNYKNHKQRVRDYYYCCYMSIVHIVEMQLIIQWFLSPPFPSPKINKQQNLKQTTWVSLKRKHDTRASLSPWAWNSLANLCCVGLIRVGNTRVVFNVSVGVFVMLLLLMIMLKGKVNAACELDTGHANEGPRMHKCGHDGGLATTVMAACQSEWVTETDWVSDRDGEESLDEVYNWESHKWGRRIRDGEGEENQSD